MPKSESVFVVSGMRLSPLCLLLLSLGSTNQARAGQKQAPYEVDPKGQCQVPLFTREPCLDTSPPPSMPTLHPLVRSVTAVHGPQPNLSPLPEHKPCPSSSDIDQIH